MSRRLQVLWAAHARAMRELASHRAARPRPGCEPLVWRRRERALRRVRRIELALARAMTPGQQVKTTDDAGEILDRLIGDDGKLRRETEHAKLNVRIAEMIHESWARRRESSLPGRP